MVDVMKKQRFTVVFEPDEGGWLATIPEVQGCLTWGKTISTARANIREALAACADLFEDPDTVAQDAELVDSFKLPAKASKLIEEAREAREAAEAVQRALSAKTAAAARALTAAGMSLRAAGELLDLSQERVRQVLKMAVLPATTMRTVRIDPRGPTVKKRSSQPGAPSNKRVHEAIARDTAKSRRSRAVT